MAEAAAAKGERIAKRLARGRVGHRPGPARRAPSAPVRVFERLPPELPRAVSVGRLALTSEGLLLLTNDGELSRALELPARGWLRRYRVRVHGDVDPARLAALAAGVTIDRMSYGPSPARAHAATGGQSGAP